ncbi:MAG: dihydroorotate dehydrogenase electron transfer subunit [Chloroflexi bacterium]|nr:dihydroorotate dehydrogenase electron transfer subunit [Chloroflexota bacterium]
MIKERQALVKSNTQITENIFLITLHNSEIASLARSGQFAMVEVPGYLLRRPLCIADVSLDKDEFSLLYATVGDGTKTLSHVQSNKNLNIVAPLGHGFPIFKNEKALVIGGGMGAATTIQLCKELLENKNSVDLLLGFRNAEAVIPSEFFPQQIDMKIATEDGSVGTKGFVTAIVPDLKRYDHIYMCGPVPMYRAMTPLLWSSTICYPKVFASFEARMGCGYGMCVGCSITVNGQKQKVCTEGPVFDFNQVDFVSLVL